MVKEKPDISPAFAFILSKLGSYIKNRAIRIKTDNAVVLVTILIQTEGSRVQHQEGLLLLVEQQ